MKDTFTVHKVEEVIKQCQIQFQLLINLPSNYRLLLVNGSITCHYYISSEYHSNYKHTHIAVLHLEHMNNRSKQMRKNLQ